MHSVDTNPKASMEPLLLERLSDDIGTWLRAYRETFASALIFGLLAHMFMLVNKLPNHDEVFTLFGKGATLSSGRWGLELLAKVLPNYSMPWFYGVLSLLLIAIACCLLVDLFGIRKIGHRILLAGLIATFPSQISIFTYMFTSGAYAIAFLCAVLSVWMFVRVGKGIKLFALAVLIFSISIYQTYLLVATSLFLLLMIKQLILDDLPWKKVLLNGIVYVGFFLGAFALYYGILYLVQQQMGAGWSQYAKEQTTILGPLWERLYLSLRILLDEIFRGLNGLVPTAFGSVLYVILLAVCAVSFLLWTLRKRDVLTVAFGAVLAILVPISIHGAYVFVSYYAVHAITLHSFVAIFILTVLLAESMMESEQTGIAKIVSRWGREIAAWGLTALLAVQVFVANERYLAMHMQYENVYAYYSAVVSRVQSLPGYRDTYPMAMIGAPEGERGYRTAFEEHVKPSVGTVQMDEEMYSKKEFIRYYLGSEMVILSDQQTEQIAQTEAVMAMPCYPNDGSVRIVDDVVVVKFS